MLRLAISFLSALFVQAALAVDVATLEKSVVRIISQTTDGVGTGTGLIVAPGYVLTNNHVIAGGNRVVVGSKHTGAYLDAQVLWQSNTLDLAVVQVADLHLLPNVTLTTRKPDKGAAVWVLGYPGASDYGDYTLDATVTRGVVSLFHHQPWHESGAKLWIIQHDAVVNPGNSGGPLFDDCGRVVGVNTAKSVEYAVEGVFLASHIAEAIPDLKRLGISLQEVDSSCTPSGTGRISLITGLGLGVLSLIAIALALRKPRRQVVRAMEYVSHSSRNYFRPLRSPENNKGGSKERPALVLTGFDTAGKKLRILVPEQGAAAVQGGYVIGRHPMLVDHLVEDSCVSRRHARITVDSGQCRIEDMNSTGGTQVNGQRLTAFVPTPVFPGDIVSFGVLKLQVSGNG